MFTLRPIEWRLPSAIVFITTLFRFWFLKELFVWSKLVFVARQAQMMFLVGSVFVFLVGILYDVSGWIYDASDFLELLKT